MDEQSKIELATDSITRNHAIAVVLTAGGENADSVKKLQAQADKEKRNENYVGWLILHNKITDLLHSLIKFE